MTYQEAYEDLNGVAKAYHNIELRPCGKITTREQYDYVIKYAEEHFFWENEEPTFEEALGKYLRMGSYFGGASFYWYLSDKPDKGGYKTEPTEYKDEFSYGNHGKLEL